MYQIYSKMNEKTNFQEKNNKSENDSSDLFPKIYATFLLKINFYIKEIINLLSYLKI